MANKVGVDGGNSRVVSSFILFVFLPQSVAAMFSCLEQKNGDFVLLECARAVVSYGVSN